jgi:uncharacterized DUF497 family protein
MGSREGDAECRQAWRFVRGSGYGLGDPLSLTVYDPDHSVEEDRYITMGSSADNRLLLVSHTDLVDGIRIISVRIATKRERKVYEND